MTTPQSAYPQATVTPQSRSSTMVPSGGVNPPGQPAPATAQPRNANFGAGAISHAVPTVGLPAAQSRYSGILQPEHIAGAGTVLGQAPNAGQPASPPPSAPASPMPAAQPVQGATVSPQQFPQG